MGLIGKAKGFIGRKRDDYDTEVEQNQLKRKLHKAEMQRGKVEYEKAYESERITAMQAAGRAKARAEAKKVSQPRKPIGARIQQVIGAPQTQTQYRYVGKKGRGGRRRRVAVSGAAGTYQPFAVTPRQAGAPYNPLPSGAAAKPYNPLPLIGGGGNGSYDPFSLKKKRRR